MRSRKTVSNPRRRKGEIDALVLEFLAQANAPLSAYDISTRAALAGNSIVPNQVYRTVARLINEGRVRRIEMLQAYALCQPDARACLVCLGCHSVVTVAAWPVETELEREAAMAGFELRRGTVEARGLCPDCRQSDAAPLRF